MSRLLAAGIVLALALIAVLALPLRANAANIYVSTVGSDTAGTGPSMRPADIAEQSHLAGYRRSQILAGT